MTGSTPRAELIAPDWIESVTLDTLSHPQETTARLRSEAPLAWVPAIGTWAATTWDLCKRIANDAENFEGVSIPVAARVFGDPHILSAEGDAHAVLRRAVATPVSARAIRGKIETRMRPTAKALIERLRGRPSTELMADYFEPISVRCVADSYGFFDVGTETLRRWFHSLKSGATNMARHADGTFMNPEGFEAADRTRAEIVEYLGEKAKEDPENPDAVIARWLDVDSEDGLGRSLDLLVPSMLVVLLGGLQEPGHALANTFFGLTTNPDQLRRVIEDPALLPKAIAEGLRWMSPLYGGPARRAKRDVVIGGVPLPEGAVVRLMYGSANHDDAYFERPDFYDLDRAAHPHLAFGDGRHACVGSALAPQIARIGLEELFAAFPRIEMDPRHSAESIGYPFHGPAELHVLLGGSPEPTPISEQPTQSNADYTRGSDSAILMTVTGKSMDGDAVSVLTLRAADGRLLPEWSPGAHIDVVLAPDLIRQYSLCGDPEDRSTWRIAVLREEPPAGRGGSERIHTSLQVGDGVEIRGPRNHFALRPADEYVFIAGGIGITPIKPMIEQVAASGARFRLVYAGRSLSTMALRAELARYGDRVEYYPSDMTGRADLDRILGESIDGALVYCCGPTSLIEAVEASCGAWPSGALRIERFTPAGIDTAGDRPFEVELARTGRTLPVPAGTSILEALEAEGVSLLSSCRAGVCGTCETAVLEGEPDHRDSVLTPEERAGNATIMVCVSRCAGRRLVLDL